MPPLIATGLELQWGESMMPCMSSRRRLWISVSSLTLVIAPGPALAQQQPADTHDAADAVSATNETDAQPVSQGPQSPAAADIVVVGSRFGQRTVTNSPTPVDVVGGEQLTRSGTTDLQSMLKVAVPTFSIPRPSSANVSDFLQSPTIRGLSTGDLLLLINGKRRHTNSDLNINNQIGRGDVAYDFSAIPTSAIKRIEVLREGAAAQYGSDAVAGVTNIVLDDSLGYLTQVQYGQTSRGDGEDRRVAVGAGFEIGSRGRLRLTAEYIDHDRTDRARPDTRQQYFGSNGTRLPSGNYGSGTGLTPPNGTLDPREASFDRDVWVYGEPKYKNRILFANYAQPITDDLTLYAFGGYNKLVGRSANFFRRAGQDQTVRALYPDGFLPITRADLENISGAVGVRSTDLAGFGFDLSTVYGYSSTKQYELNSNNASLGAASPRSFYLGAERFWQWTSNLDVIRSIPIGDGEPVKLGFGAEYRKEWFRLAAGEPASYINGNINILDGPNAGRPAPVGAQPNPGFTDANARLGSRTAKGVYGEVEKTLFKRLMLVGALRFEDYSDFGSTTNYKLAGRLQVARPFALRASYGTGFRAPALTQIIYNSSTTNFFNGQPVTIRLISTTDPIAPLVGAPALRPEKSRDLSIGGVFTSGTFTASVDLYRVVLKKRLALSSAFSSTALINYLAAQGFPGISSVSFVTNGVDSTSRGVDVASSYRRQFLGGQLNATFAANFNKIKLDRVAGTPAPLAALGVTAPLADLTNRVRLTESTPKNKITLDLSWERGPLHLSLINTQYGEVSQVALTGRTRAQVDALTPGYDIRLVPNGANFDIIQTFRADIVTDLQASYDVAKPVRLTIGVSNVFNKYPEKLIASTVQSVAAGTNGADNNGIFPYAFISPYGFSGRTFYGRITTRF